MMTEREKSEVVRADILRILWERGDRPAMLCSSDLQVPEYEHLFFSSARWLEAEGLIRLGNGQNYTGKNAGQGQFSSASLTSNGERFLGRKPSGQLKPLGDLLRDAFRDAAKREISDAIKRAPQLLMSAYDVWRTTNL